VGVLREIQCEALSTVI